VREWVPFITVTHFSSFTEAHGCHSGPDILSAGPHGPLARRLRPFMERVAQAQKHHL